MIENESYRGLLNGKSVFFRTWQPDDGKSVGRVITLHGSGEHSAYYAPLAQVLTDRGYSVMGFDFIGHGKSEGKRGCVSYAQVFEIVNGIKEELWAHDSHTPIYLFGHSLGGSIALSYGIQFPDRLRGVIASAPPIRFHEPDPAATLLLRVLRRFVPDFTRSNGVLPKKNTQVSGYLRRIMEDPLVHDRMSVTLLMDLMEAAKSLRAYDTAYPVPLLLLVGDADRLVDPKAVTGFSERVRGDVFLQTMPGAKHGWIGAHGSEPYMESIADWMNSRQTSGEAPETCV